MDQLSPLQFLIGPILIKNNCVTQHNITYCLFNEPLEYNNWMLGKLSLLLSFLSIWLLYYEGLLNKQ